MRDSAAILLFADDPATAVWPPPVYLVERNPKLRFFGGYMALPGGVRDIVDGEDDPEAAEADRIPLARCAVRELFEETGVLPPPPGVETLHAQWGDNLDQLRQDLLANREGASDRFATALQPHALHQQLERLCRIRTPPFAPVRYDTLFFATHLAAGETPSIEHGELVGGRFWSPADALDAWVGGRHRVVPPLVIVLEHLVGSPDYATFRQRIAATTEAYWAGALHRVRFSPGIVLAPLTTETLPPATTTNCLVVGESELWVVDPASPNPAEQARLEHLLLEMAAEGRAVRGVLSTHHHPDHVGGIAAVCERFDVAVRGHQLTLDRLPATCSRFRGAPLDDGDRIELGTAPDGSTGWHLTAWHTPGHDRGHLCFRESRYGAWIGGDLASTVSTIMIDPPEGHMRTYLDSVRRIQDQPTGTFYPAHGPAAPDSKRLLERLLDHRNQRQIKLLDALSTRAQSIEELVAEVYADVGTELHAYASRSLQAGLEMAVEDGRAIEEDGGWRQP